MKKFTLIIFVCLFFTAGCIYYVRSPYEEGPPPEEDYEEYYYEESEEALPELDISYFYDYLSPHGIWIYYAPYGYVWTPNSLGYGWRPYTFGRWVWTDYGWTWRSQFKWGWAPFHYGRWGWDSELGWFWVPDTVWGPGWVTWRSSDLYIGWAPLSPEAHFIAGVGIKHLRFPIPVSHWIFIDGSYFLSPSVNHYIFPYERNITIIHYTVHRTNIYVRNKRIVNGGIDIDQIERITKQKITRHKLKSIQNAETRTLGPDTLEVYRPRIMRSKDAKPKNSIDRNKAKDRMTRTRIIEQDEVKEVQKREIELIEQSHQKEVGELKRKEEKEKKSAETPKDKERVEKKYKDKEVELRKIHQKEKSQIEKRHEEETKEVKKKTEKKKVKKKKNIE